MPRIALPGLLLKEGSRSDHFAESTVQDMNGHPSAIINRRELQVLALRRSGHHAVIHWIIRQARGRVMFLNNCRPNVNPFLSHNPYESQTCGCDIQAEARGELSDKDWLIYNFEDRPPHCTPGSLFEQCAMEWVGRSDRRIRLIVLRDPFNLFASKLRWAYGRWNQPDLDTIASQTEIWKDYARYCLNREKQRHPDEAGTRLSAAGAFANLSETSRGKERNLGPQQPEMLVVRYNRWVTDKAYRRRLAEQLGLEFTDAGRNEVARWGPVTWGDSFDGLEYDGRAQQMKVLTRWRRFADNEFYRSLFRDPELVALSNQVFGEIPGTKVLWKQRLHGTLIAN